MNKSKTLKITAAIFFIILSGILYSCSFLSQKDKIIPLEKNSTVNSNKVKEENSKDESKQSSAWEATPGDSSETNEESVSGQNQDAYTSATEAESKGNQNENESMLYVHVCGAVKKPDVYEVKSGTRIVEVIKLAGGLTQEAAGDYVNQAAEISDGQQIYIPSKDEVIGNNIKEYSPDLSGKNTNLKKLVNINSASMEELMTLTGIGESKAKSIIDYRQKNGGFKNIEDIKNIAGIKDSVFNKICDMITIK
jgi:competence protein ComEA